MLSHGAHEFAVEIEVTQPAVLAVAHQQQRLIVTRIHRQSVAAIEQSFCASLAAIARLVLPLAVEAKNARVAVAIGDEDGPIRRRARLLSAAIRSAL